MTHTPSAVTNEAAASLWWYLRRTPPAGLRERAEEVRGAGGRAWRGWAMVFAGGARQVAQDVARSVEQSEAVGVGDDLVVVRQ